MPKFNNFKVRLPDKIQEGKLNSNVRWTMKFFGLRVSQMLLGTHVDQRNIHYVSEIQI